MNKPVQITLNEPFVSFVEDEVRLGSFGSAEEVVEAGLRLLEQDKLQKLREALIESENCGPAELFDRDEIMGSIRQDWKERG